MLHVCSTLYDEIFQSQMEIDEKNHWANVDRQYERINKVIAASTRLTKIYREDLFNLCEKIKGTPPISMIYGPKFKISIVSPIKAFNKDFR